MVSFLRTNDQTLVAQNIPLRPHQAGSQMSVTAVLFVRSDGEHQNATAAETMSLFDDTNFARMEIFPDPTA